MITVHNAPIDEIDKVTTRLGRNMVAIERGVGTLLYSLLDTIGDHYFPVVERTGGNIEALERRIITIHDPRSTIRVGASGFKKRSSCCAANCSICADFSCPSGTC